MMYFRIPDQIPWGEEHKDCDQDLVRKVCDGDVFQAGGGGNLNVILEERTHFILMAALLCLTGHTLQDLGPSLYDI